MSGVSFAVGVVAIDPVPAGGTTGQALVKKSDSDYDTQWSSVVDPATLGTMSTQNANSVAITGGAINGTTIGSTTPAAATFTTLTATGTSYLGGSSTSRGVQVDPVSGGTTQVTQFSRSVAINEQQIIAANTANLGLVATGGGTINFWTATSSEKQFVVGRTASAVNYVQVTGAATGNSPIFAAQGSDTNIGIAYQAKGSTSHIFNGNTGTHFAVRTDIANAVNYWQAFGDSAGVPRLRTNGGTATLESGAATGFVFSTNANTAAAQQFAIAHTASAVNYVQVTGGATNATNYPRITAEGSDSAVWLNLSGKGAAGIRLFSDSSVNEQLRIARTASAVNRMEITGAAAGGTPSMSSQGTDTNISLAFQSKGTGAIDLAAGSRGVNISNGGTVTAMTVTALGSSYTSIPAVAITAPTTAGGVQATALAQMGIWSGAITSGGTGYTVNDVLTVTGGAYLGGTAQQFKVTSVSGGVITGISTVNFPTYTILPSSPASVTGGTGSGATVTITWCLYSFNITNAGSGYIEQPTVTFSGGGGSGAAAYASVGSAAIVKGLAGTNNLSINFQTPAGSVLQLHDSGAATPNALIVKNATTPFLLPALTNTNLTLSSNGTGSVVFTTNNTAQNQLVVAHTASAVNYVQVTGAATGVNTNISAQGSDTNIGINFQGKGTGAFSFFSQGGTTARQFRIDGINNSANYLQVAGSSAGSAPVLSAQGSDTNIDLALTPKGTGLVRFGTYTAGAPTATGYISIKAADGTTYKVLVGT